MNENEFLKNVGAGRDIAMKVLVGSHNYNLNNERSDKDYKFFVFPSFDDLYDGLRFSDAKQSDNFDYSVHDVRSLGDLIATANLNFIEVLYSTEKIVDYTLQWLYQDADVYATANLPRFYSATYGMAYQKIKELHKGTAKTDVLISEFGYDTKQASHAIRCLYTLSHFLCTGKMQSALWYKSDSFDRNVVLNVKNGFYSENDFLSLIKEWEVFWGSETKRFFQSQQPNMPVLEQLNYKIKEVIKARF